MTEYLLPKWQKPIFNFCFEKYLGGDMCIRGFKNFGICLFLVHSFIFYCAAEQDQTETSVDVLLVIAVDISSSVKPDELLLQRKGAAEALRSPNLARVLEQCNASGIAMTYVEWSGFETQREVNQTLGWTKLKTAQDLIQLAQQIEGIPNRVFFGSTDIASAVEESQKFIQNSPFEGHRKIILISGDGKHNVSPAHLLTGKAAFPVEAKDIFLRGKRDAAYDSGITISALALLTSDSEWERDIEQYFEENVIIGPGSFVEPVRSYQDYRDSLEQMLVRQLNNCTA